jgi:tetrahydromethanopterin S-methyltransferase subunit E
MEEIVLGIGITALAGALAAIAGAAEDTESDIGSQGDPNSQVQLAPQMGYIHRIFNKAIAGEPPAYAAWCAIGAGVAWVFLQLGYNPALAIILGSTVAVFIQGIYCISGYLGRTASLAKFEQPVYIDIIKSLLSVTMAHAFIAIFCTVAVCYLMATVLHAQPFAMPILGLLWGLALGAAGSATGNPFYGKERQYQNQNFGAGVPISASGNIVRYAEAGERSSLDNGWFTTKFAGPASGICFGLIVFLELWRTVLFEHSLGGWGAVLAGVALILIFALINLWVEKWGRETYGPYTSEETSS